MATEAQIEANRVNAQKSTGPRMPEGKEKASQNALKHGLLTRKVVVPGEDPEEFACHRDQMLAEMAPAGPMESLLAERIVVLSWRLLRAERLQTAAVGTLAEEKKKWVWSKEDNQYVVLQGTKPGPVARRVRGGGPGGRPQGGEGLRRGPDSRPPARLRGADRALPLSDHGPVGETAAPGAGKGSRKFPV